MLTKAVRLYGPSDLRLEEFELPPIKDDEICAKIISDSICMSSYKAAVQGEAHKRVPHDIATNPTIIGHEFCGELVEVGKTWAADFKKGDRFSIQPALNYKGRLDAPGYSYTHVGGDATYVILPKEVMEMDCLLPYEGDSFFAGSLAEPVSCIIGGFHANYHTTGGSYVHSMGVVEGGKMALLAGVGPMGLGAIDYAIHCDRKPSVLVVTDIDDARLERAARLFTVEEAHKNGVELHYVNTAKPEHDRAYLKNLAGGDGFDDVFVYAPVKPVIEQADGLLGRDGCLNFFAGPTNPDFKAEFNFYNVHYASTHIVGTSGGNTDDMREALKMMAEGKLSPAVMITHVGGLDAVVETTLNLPNIPGGKKLIYNGIKMDLVALDELSVKGVDNALYAALGKIVDANDGIWCGAAEKYLLENAPAI